MPHRALPGLGGCDALSEHAGAAAVGLGDVGVRVDVCSGEQLMIPGGTWASCYSKVSHYGRNCVHLTNGVTGCQEACIKSTDRSCLNISLLYCFPEYL